MDIEDAIKGIIAEYVPKLLLQRHTFEVKKGVDDQKSFMECLPNYPYLNATIAYSKECEEEWKKGKDIVPYVVHEMCHCVTEPLYCKAIGRYAGKNEILDERENMTDWICNIVIGLGGKL